jgi:hypothetical protein
LRATGATGLASAGTIVESRTVSVLHSIVKVSGESADTAQLCELMYAQSVRSVALVPRDPVKG